MKNVLKRERERERERERREERSRDLVEKKKKREFDPDTSYTNDFFRLHTYVQEFKND